MKYLFVIFILLCTIFPSCGPSKAELEKREKCRQDEIRTKDSIRASLKNTFDAPFPKRNRNLSRILGDSLQIQGKCCPITLKIISTKKSNSIINSETGETIFKGTVCKYRDLYYCSEQINDTSFRIFALKINDSLIYGLQNYFQYLQTDTAIDHKHFQKLVKRIDKINNIIRLQPDKKELKHLFTSIINSTIPFAIIRSNVASKNSNLKKISNQIDIDNFEYLSKAYPNPTSDFINIELQEKSNVTYILTNIEGKIILQGQFTEKMNRVDLSKQPEGIYALTIINLTDNDKETIKIVKSK